MGIDSDRAPEGALEDVAFLSRSGNRLRVLRTLATGPHSRRELEEASGASRPTLRRILAELADRGWTERTPDGEFVATAKGDHVVSAFTPLIESMQAIRTLDDAVSWLPADELPIGLEHFSDATVRRAHPSSPVAEASYLHERLRDASTFANLTSVGPPLSMMETTRDGVAAGRLTATTVLTERVLEYVLTHPEQASLWYDYVAEGARVYRYAGEIPCNLFVVDGTVLVGNSRSEVGRPCEFVETDDEAVLSWARDTIESYRADADRLLAEEFANESSIRAGQDSP